MTLVGGSGPGLLQRLRPQVAARAGTWFPGLTGRVEVRLVRAQRRATCVLHRLEVTDGAVSALLLAKTRTGGSGERRRTDTGRPQLIPDLPISDRDRSVREFEGLRRAARAVADARPETGASRLAAVRPLLLLQEDCTIVMDFVDLPTLRSRLIRSSLLPLPRHRTWSRQDEPWRALGTWLRHYQQPVDPELPARAWRSTEVLDQLTALADHVGGVLGDRQLTRELARCADRVASALPGTFPLGVSHGDLAARNVLVGEDGRVTVVDPMPRWRAPVYDDLARLVMSARASRPQLASGGRLIGPRRLDRIEQAVLEGFFDGGPPDSAAVALFQLLVLLDDWAGTLAASRTAPRRLLAGAQRRQYRLECLRLMQVLEGR